MKTFKKKTTDRKIIVSKRDSAEAAIGVIEKSSDTFILTYGQFSLIDALVAILKQTGPAHVTLSTWTAAHAHLDQSAALLESAEILSFRMIIDVSFKTRQPKYYNQMIDLFGANCIREIKTHAKFIVIKNDNWNIVVRTSMNLNGNPRLENIEISESEHFTEFFEQVADDVFNEVAVGNSGEAVPDLLSIKDSNKFKLIESSTIKSNTLNEPRFSHEIRK